MGAFGNAAILLFLLLPVAQSDTDERSVATMSSDLVNVGYQKTLLPIDTLPSCKLLPKDILMNGASQQCLLSAQVLATKNCCKYPFRSDFFF
jgi:hypothetical protein